MPYKDPEKRRAVQRASMRRLRAERAYEAEQLQRARYTRPARMEPPRRQLSPVVMPHSVTIRPALSLPPSRLLLPPSPPAQRTAGPLSISPRQLGWERAPGAPIIERVRVQEGAWREEDGQYEGAPAASRELTPYRDPGDEWPGLLTYALDALDDVIARFRRPHLAGPRRPMLAHRAQDTTGPAATHQEQRPAQRQEQHQEQHNGYDPLALLRDLSGDAF